MGGASTLLLHVSEISFPIQKRIEFGRLGELDLVDPAGALGALSRKRLNLLRGSEITRWADTGAELPAGLKTASLSKPPRRQFSPSRLRFTAGVFQQNRG